MEWPLETPQYASHGLSSLLHVLHGLASAFGVVFDLILVDLADSEVARLRMTRSSKPLTAAPGCMALLSVSVTPVWAVASMRSNKMELLRVVRLGWIARRGTDAAVAFADQFLIAEVLPSSS